MPPFDELQVLTSNRQCSLCFYFGVAQYTVRRLGMHRVNDGSLILRVCAGRRNLERQRDGEGQDDESQGPARESCGGLWLRHSHQAGSAQFPERCIRYGAGAGEGI